MTVRQHRIIQWLIIILILFLGAGWYWRAHTEGAEKINASQNTQNASGLIGEWSFDGADVSGTTAYDRSGNGNNGTLTNGPVPTIGKVGQALSFDGSDDYVDFPASIISISGSVSMWFKFDTISSKPYLWAFGNNGSSPELRILVQDGILDFYVYDNGAYQSTLGTPFSDTSGWHHLVGTWTTNNFTFYLDGSLVGQDTSGSITHTTSTHHMLGYYSWDGTATRFDGQMDEVRLYSRALSASEISALYQSGAAKVKAPSKDGLVGYWSLDEGSGTQAGDMSGNGNDGTLTNGPTWADGRFGKALNFDGVNDYVNVADNSSLKPTGAITYSVWFKSSSWPSVFSSIVEKGNANNAGYLFGVNQNGQACVILRVTGGTISGGVSSAFTQGQWNHVAVTYNGTSVVLYINGVSQTLSSVTSCAIGNASGTIVHDTSIFTIGMRQGSAYPFSGNVDEVRIYNRALSASEVTGLYQNGLTKVNASQNSLMTNGLVGEWSFNGADVSGLTAYDRSGSGNNGTLTNGPAAAIGKVGQALSFDGSDDYVTMGATTAYDFSGQQFSYGGWFYLNSLPPAGSDQCARRFGLFGNRDWGWSADLINDGKINMRRYTSISSAYSLVSNATFQAGQWYQFMVVQDASTLRLYVNGQLDNSVAAPNLTTYYHSTDNPEIGRMQCGVTYYYLNGKFDEARIYNRALSADEVSALYNMGR